MKLNNNIWKIAQLLMLLLSISCTQEQYFEDTQESSKLVDIKLTMAMVGGVPQSTNLTRDIRVEHVNLYIYEMNSLKQYFYKEMRVVDNIEKTTDGKFKFVAQLAATNQPSIIYLIANQSNKAIPLPSVLPSINPDKDATLLISPSDINYSLIGTADIAIPMAAKISLPVIDATTVGPEVDLLRAMSRVDLKIKTGISQFKLMGISAWFTPDRNRSISTDIIEMKVQTPTMPASYLIIPEDPKKPSTAIQSPVRWDHSDANGVTSIENKIYLNENIDFTKNPSLTNRNSRIVVWGYYNNSSSLSYYPIDFTSADGTESMAILRNYKYNITINDVKNDGYTTEKEAAYSESIGISATIISWSDNNQDIIFDGANWFSIESKKVSIGGIYGTQKRLVVSSTVKSSEWKMAWGDTDVFPADTEYQQVNTLTAPDFASVAKPLPELTDTRSGVIIFNSLLKTGDKPVTKYLFIKVNNRLQLHLTVTVYPDGYSTEDWDDEGDDLIEID